MSDALIQPATAADYDRIIAVVDDWWGRPLSEGLPRLFLDHFRGTSLVADDSEGLAGFLVGFHSPSNPGEAYIHYVAVAPRQRGTGLGRRLYEAFFERAARDGCTSVHAVTAPVNTRSVAFHRAMGFTVAGPVRDYNGTGRDLMVFQRQLP